ncbi:uncharacterized protein SPSK_09947 [Sporothrix schenckii 1099-18]|uniref:Uncharacterized protein n=1 Tax=Sporothrix schenckii 1099-18 TaxID=1397361 RepID=A0A0F2MD21_SPOSC|nr:uncharacterized protein SPSK_09947 [Sporothrix schenckii 1099-18]KJR86041.1 hypothetical protein SPSK_09947 [Sporothrix schenckii 1099-18]
MARRATKWALEGISVPPLPGISSPGDPMDHPLHCVDWIRQALMCNVDLSLDATEDFWTFGHESRHNCRDFIAVLSWTEENRYRGSLADLRKITPAMPAPWLQD